jgi:hypothetical protein
MIDVNEILAEFFQKRPEPDADGVFHYLLQERDAILVIETTPYGPQWDSVLQKDTLIVDCERNRVGLLWVSNGIYRATLGGPLPVETILYQDDEDEDDPHRHLVFVCSDLIARVDLPPDPLSFWIGSREYFYQMSYEEQSYRVLSSKKPPLA